jgi:hypothetical protein
MAASKRTRLAPETIAHEASVIPAAASEPTETEALVSLLPSAAQAPREAEPEQPLPAYAVEEPVEEVRPDPDAEPLPKEYLVLAGPASFGPVRIGGRAVTAKKDRLYHVPDLAERVDVLGSGRFRAATVADLARAGSPSAGKGGAITRGLLPEGAVKGGLVKP